jgi:hypothetical protein
MVGPGRSWLLPEGSWPAVPILHGLWDTVFRGQARNLERTDVRKEASGGTGMQQRHKGPRFKGAATFRKQVDIQQGPWTNHWTGGCDASFPLDYGTWMSGPFGGGGGSAPSVTKEETARRVGAGDVGALTTIRSFTPTDRKSRMQQI